MGNDGGTKGSGLLVTALAYRFGLRKEADNEVQVLATAVDQYLQQVFEELDFRRSGLLRADDFHTFCANVGLYYPDVVGGVADDLTFREFHARLCRHFSRTGNMEYVPFECKNAEKEYREALERLWNIGKVSDQHNCSCKFENQDTFNLGTSTPKTRSVSFEVPHLENLRSKQCYFCSTKRDNMDHTELDLSLMNPKHVEIDTLREIIEDMRAALQCSDSRCLALQVAVSNFQNACLCYNANQTLTPTSPCKVKDTSIRKGHTSLSIDTESDLDPETYIRELQRELKATRRRLYETNQKNKDLTFHMERMAETFEKTKAVILVSLEKVKGLENQAKEIPVLEVRVLELQRELDRSKRFLRLNNDVTKDSAISDTPSLSPARSDSSSEASTKDSGQASREDLDLSIITTSLESINDMVDNMLIARLQEQVKSLMNEVKEIREERANTANQITRLRLHNDALQTELHNTETERVRMSIIEEKLVDIVGSFRQLRRVHLPMATIGNLLMSVVEGIEDDVIAEHEVLIFVNQLQRKLTTYELTFWNPTPSPQRAKKGTYI